MPLMKLLKKPAKDYSKLEKFQLIDDHRLRHAWYSSTKQGKQIHDKETGKLLTLKDISEQHTKIVRKMFSLKIKHNYVPNSVDQTLPKNLKEKSKKMAKSTLDKIIKDALIKKIKDKRNTEGKYTHKDCKNFKDGRCLLKNKKVDPNGPICPSFKLKK